MSEDSLVDFIASVSGDAHLAVEENLGSGYVRLRTAEAERRQAKHDIRCVEDIVIEMLRNARDANARNIYVASTKEGNVRTLVLIDDGDGIPADMHETIFEPRVTSKLESMVMDTWGVHGRGMALYSIRANADSVKVASSAPGFGAAFVVNIDTSRLTERTDQSTMPVIERNEDGVYEVASGPHNIARIIAEFSLEEKDKLKVFFGSPAEIIAALIEAGRHSLTDAELLFCDDIEKLPVFTRPCMAEDAARLADICTSIGLSISSRTAHRILAGKIKKADCLLDRLMKRHRRSPKATKADIYSDSRGLKISREDLDWFSRSMESAFQELSERYYLQLADEPKIRVGKDAITVTFSIEKDL